MIKRNFNFTFQFSLLLGILGGLFTSNMYAHSSEQEFVFIENKGQWPKNVKYRVKLESGYLYLENDKLTYQFYDYSELLAHHAKPLNTTTSDIKLKQHSYQVLFEKKSSISNIVATNQTSNYFNYFLGEKSKWASNVRGYEKVIYQNIYDKIDLVFYSSKGSLKYDFIVHPGANSNEIKLLYKGVDKINIKNQELIIKNSINTVFEEKPYTYQNINGVKTKIPCNYALNGNKLSFEVSKNINKIHPVIIDPALVFASYTGSFADNFGMSATYDNTGHLYAGGTVFGINYPTTLGAYQTTFNGTVANGITDVSISKFSPDGTNLIYSTYLGGTGTETIHSMIVSDNNELFIYGVTSSNDFPVTNNAFQSDFAGGQAIFFQSNGSNFTTGTDIYVTRFNDDGTDLLGSTYIGGVNNDGINYNASNFELYDSLMFNYGDQFRGEIMLDEFDNCYITSSTRSTDFPVTSGFDNTFSGIQDGVVFKFNPTLSSLIWSNFLGGSEKDAGFSIKVDETQNVYVTGGTSSIDFPTTTGVLNETYLGGKADGYISKISADGSTILNSSYLGTTLYDQIFFIELDRFNNIYLLGQSLGNIPVINAAYSNTNSKQFITKLNNQLNSINYSTVFGNGSGSVNFSPSAFLVDKCQNVYVSGWGGDILGGGPMNNMPTTPDALYPASLDGYDYYFAVFEKDLVNLTYASYFGGNQSQDHVDGGTSRFDKRGIIYQSVCASCGPATSDFPTTANAWSTIDNSPGRCNNGVFKFDFEIIVSASFQSSDITACGATPINFSNESQGGDVFYWDYGNGVLDTSNIGGTFTYGVGEYLVTLTAHDTICDIRDTIQKNITIYEELVSSITDSINLCEPDTVTAQVNTQGAASEFVWSTNTSFTDTLNSSLTDSIINYFANESQTIYVQSINGVCQKIDSIHIQINSFQLSVDSTVTDCGACIASAEVTPSTNSFTYAYLWSNGQNNATTNNLCIGFYQVTVQNEFGCSTNAQVEVIDSSEIVLQIQNTIPVSCNNICDASLSSSISQAISPIEYLWSNGDTTSTLTNICSGMYNLTITDSAGCGRVAQFELIEPEILAFSNALLVNPNCEGTCTGSIQLEIQGGTIPYGYEWSNNQTTQTLQNGCSKIYSVTIEDENGCSIDSIFELQAPEKFTFNLTTSDPRCFNDCSAFIEVDINNPQDYEYQLSGVTDWTNESIFNNLCPGDYEVLVRDTLNCSASDSATINVTSFTPFPVNLLADRDTVIAYESVTLQAQPTQPGNYSWSPSFLVDDPTSLITTATVTDTTVFSFVVKDINNPNCKFESNITIYVREYICDDPSVFIPNAFTPNNDNNNDILFVRGSNLEDIYFTVFNRWGEAVFETTDVNVGWDGDYKNKKSDPGVFDYYLKATCPNQEKVFIKGNVTLIR